VKDSGIFAFAGVWTVAQPKDAAEKIASCAIITTSANRDVSFVHDRMPVVLDGIPAEAAWLDPDVDLDAALELVRPLPDGLLDVYPLSTEINSSRVEGIELLLRSRAMAATEACEPHSLGTAPERASGAVRAWTVYWTMIVVVKSMVEPSGNTTWPSMMYVPGVSGSVR
jgi:hypothetical protein